MRCINRANSLLVYDTTRSARSLLLGQSGCLSLHCSGCLLKASIQTGPLIFLPQLSNFRRTNTTHQLSFKSLDTPEITSDALNKPRMEPEEWAAPHRLLCFGKQSLTWICVIVVNISAIWWRLMLQPRWEEHAGLCDFKITPILTEAKE